MCAATPDPGSPASSPASSAGGSRDPMAQLVDGLHPELRRLAARYLRGERKEHSLQPTELVHEACVRLLGGASVDDATHTHVFAVAATAMRRVLVDHARRRAAKRRGAECKRVTLDESLLGDKGSDLDVLAVDEALHRLAHLDDRQARIVELRFFAGLNDDEIAASLGVSRRTVQGDWQMARAWLRRELSRR
jgi:RNA polymerase sigma factor (TIGR02999 family)